MRPVFILSLPRSGSSWLQRLLSASSSRVASADEPWLLLPLIYAMRDHGAVSEYGHATACRAIRSFFDRLPDGDAVFGRLVRQFAEGAYASHCHDGQDVFIDKTPHYSLIGDEILRYFPQCKMVILLRNPLAVAASVCEIWGNGAWVVHKCEIAFRLGLPNLLRLAEMEDERIVVVRYEDLQQDTEATVSRLCDALGIERDRLPDGAAAVPTKRAAGALGDTKYLRKNAVLGENSVTWPEYFRSPFRRGWAANLRRDVGLDRLDRFGYNVDEIFEAMRACPLNATLTVRDVSLTYPVSKAFQLFGPTVFRARLRRRREVNSAMKFIYQ